MSTTIIQEIRTTGSDLIEKVKEVINEGNVRRITIKNEEDEILITVPLTFGIVGFGTTIFAIGPILTALGFFALFMNDYSIIVEREVEEDKNEVEAQIIDIEEEDEDEEDDDEE